jgi:hypothetical protein
MVIGRRSLLLGLVSAPAILRLDALMPVKAWRPSIIGRNGLLLCNGAQLSARAYPDLFAVLGHTYGGLGDGFNLPNLQSSHRPGLLDYQLNPTLDYHIDQSGMLLLGCS